jgi:hypothetical protein
MKSTRLLQALAPLLFLMAPQVHATCTNATAAGTFGFTTNGSLILPTGPIPVAAVGSITFDLNGNAIGSQDRSLGGAFARETINGTIAVNRDCTITIAANVYDSNGNLGL